MVDAWVLLVDENDDFLDGLAAWMYECPGFHVAGIAHSAAEAYERIPRLAPDIVLMDISLPDGNGLDVTRRIKAKHGAPLVILTTFHEAGAVRAEAKAAGADACISKPDITEEFSRVAGALWAERHGRNVPPPGTTGTTETDKTSHRRRPNT